VKDVNKNTKAKICVIKEFKPVLFIFFNNQNLKKPLK